MEGEEFYHGRGGEGGFIHFVFRLVGGSQGYTSTDIKTPLHPRPPIAFTASPNSDTCAQGMSKCYRYCRCFASPSQVTSV